MLTRRVKKVFEENNGILTPKQAVDSGLSKESLRRAHKRGDLLKEERGIYLLDSSYLDDLYITQLKYTKGVFSHETAVMLHSLSTYSPFIYHLTFKKGYHLLNPEKDNIRAHYSILEDRGIVEMESWDGNPLKVTDLERTMVEMLKTKAKMPGLMDEIISNYLWNEKKDLEKLKSYAEVLNVSQLVKEKVLTHVKSTKNEKFDQSEV